MSTFSVTQHARSTPFDNSTNGYLATNLQDAIEETNSLLLYVISITRNGTMSNGDWIGKGELLANTASYVCPRKLQLIGMSWANSSANVDFDLEFYKNGRATTKFRTYEARNLTYGYGYGWTDAFNDGDYLDIKYIDQGDNAADFAIDLIFKAVS